MQDSGKVEELSEKIFTQVYDILLPYSQYIENPTGSFVEHQGKKYYSPGFEVFEYLVSNIVLAMILHLFSHYLYEKYFAKKAKLSKIDLEEVKRIVRTELKDQSDQMNSLTRDKNKNEDFVLLQKIEELLSNNGMPSDKAKIIAGEILKKIKDIN